MHNGALCTSWTASTDQPQEKLDNPSWTHISGLPGASTAKGSRDVLWSREHAPSLHFRLVSWLLSALLSWQWGFSSVYLSCHARQQQESSTPPTLGRQLAVLSFQKRHTSAWLSVLSGRGSALPGASTDCISSAAHNSRLVRMVGASRRLDVTRDWHFISGSSVREHHHKL